MCSCLDVSLHVCPPPHSFSLPLSLCLFAVSFTCLRSQGQVSSVLSHLAQPTPPSKDFCLLCFLLCFHQSRSSFCLVFLFCPPSPFPVCQTLSVVMCLFCLYSRSPLLTLNCQCLNSNSSPSVFVLYGTCAPAFVSVWCQFLSLPGFSKQYKVTVSEITDNSLYRGLYTE